MTKKIEYEGEKYELWVITEEANGRKYVYRNSPQLPFQAQVWFWLISISLTIIAFRGLFG